MAEGAEFPEARGLSRACEPHGRSIMAGWRLSHLKNPKILVVRNDGLGDFILTLPLIASLKRQAPDARIYVLVNTNIQGLIPVLPDIEGAIPDEGVLLKRHRDLYPPSVRRQQRGRLLEKVRSFGFDLAILPYGESASAALVHQAHIPVRVGSLRRHFFWRFNLHNRESRRSSTRTEFELNLSYLECLGLANTFAFPRLELASQGSGETLTGGLRNYAVVHPCKRSGSSPAWPEEQFVRLAEELMGAGHEVVVVGDGRDTETLTRLFAALPMARVLTDLSLARLTALIAGASMFIGNSSGPLHLAGLAGTPHVGLYPQSRVDAPARWRTLPCEGAPEAFRDYLLAPQFPRDCVTCDKEKCPYYNCVGSITLHQIWEALAVWGWDREKPGGKLTGRAAGSFGSPGSLLR